jgi:flagellar protein FlaG
MSNPDNTIGSSVLPIHQVSKAGDSLSQGKRQTLTDGGNAVPHSHELPVGREQLDSAIRDIEKFLGSVERKLEFRVDNEIGRTVITVRDAQTDEVVRQMPTQEVVEMARYLADISPDVALGLLVDSQA